MTDRSSPPTLETSRASPSLEASRARPLFENVETVRETLESAPQLLACFDFDGTLAPIVDDPDDARPRADAQRALVALAGNPNVTTAVVTGRALSDVRTRIEGPTIYAGNHGLELARNDSIAIHPIARKRASRLTAICATLEVVLESVPGTRIENKRLTGTVHVRSVPPELHHLVERFTHAIVERFSGGDLEVSGGKQIFEIGPSIPWGKGNAVELLAADHPPGTVVCYIGDDVTDESAFRAVEPDGIGIRVGDGETVASRRVESPAEVARFIDWLGSAGVAALG